MEFYNHAVQRDVLILRADAAMDSYNVQEYLDELQRLIAAGARKLVVDCSELGYLSSVGITALIRMHKRMSEHDGSMRLVAVQGPLMRLLDITRLNQVFHTLPTLDEALRSFEEERPPVA